MRWTPGGRSGNLEDRRGSGGFGGPLGIGGGIVTLILALIFGPGILQDGSGDITTNSPGQVGLSPADSAAEEPMVQFVSFVLDDAQSTWQQKFREGGSNYQPANLVLFRGGTQTGCGVALRLSLTSLCRCERGDSMKIPGGLQGQSPSYLLAGLHPHHIPSG